MSSMKIAHFVPIGQQTWLPLKLGRKHRYGMSSMKIAHFVPIGQQTWPPHAILVSDWSISKKSSPLKWLSHMSRNLVGSIYMYGRFCIKFPQSRMKGERHRLSPLNLQLSYPLKLLGQLEAIFTDKKFVRSLTTKSTFGLDLAKKTWPPWAILILFIAYINQVSGIG